VGVVARPPSLPRAPSAPEALGRDTVMDRGLALRYGADYVHLAAFAIDLDRIREALEEDDEDYDQGTDAWPFGWEVFLTEAYLLSQLDPARRDHRDLVQETVDVILDAGPGSELLGAQLVFALYDAVARGAWPEEAASVFRTWKHAPDELVRALRPLWEDAETHQRELAESCLEAEITPPIIAPTRAALERLARGC